MQILKDAGILPGQRPKIREFPYLREPGPTANLEDLLLMRSAFDELRRCGEQDVASNSIAPNLVHSDPHLVEAISKLYGPEGLAKFQLLCFSSEHSEFIGFYEMIKADIMTRLLFANIPEKPISLDNPRMRCVRELDAFCHNLVNISLSRKLFNPGNREGYVVYGLGGARILLSLPFKGINKYHYDIYNNTSDVITSLMCQGYFGTFLALDRNEGLDKKYQGIPGWLIWFSFVAAHSDMVIFVKEKSGDLTASQYREARMTPDRIPKKIIEIDQLTWGKADTLTAEQKNLPEIFSVPKKGLVSEEEFRAEERKHAEQFIEVYWRGNFPRDRLILIHEDDHITEQPLIDAA